MTILEIVILLVLAAVCGFLAQIIAGYSRGGVIVAMVIGFIGAAFGLWMARTLNLPEPFALTIGEVQFPVIWSIIGATLFMAVVGLLTRRRYYK